jgi:natural resistance-associated macrophage protein
VTGQGLMGLIRDRYGPRYGSAAPVARAGKPRHDVRGASRCSRWVRAVRHFPLPGGPSVTVGVSVLVLGGQFHRVEHLLMALAAVFVAYIAAGFVTQPDGGQAAMGLVVPRMPLTAEAILIVTATVGTTLAPGSEFYPVVRG